MCQLTVALKYTPSAVFILFSCSLLFIYLSVISLAPWGSGEFLLAALLFCSIKHVIDLGKFGMRAKSACCNDVHGFQDVVS